jgi:hypothetical protein
MKFTKKGQAALEFLTTYGWAFLVILVMIGALGYFGVLSPGNFLPQRCNVGPEFSCDDYQAERIDGGVDTVTVSSIYNNNIGEAMQVDPADFTASSGDASLNSCSIGIDQGSLDNTAGVTQTVSAGGDLWIVCEFDNAAFPPIGDKAKFLIEGSYLPIGNSFQKPLTSEIYATLQQG